MDKAAIYQACAENQEPRDELDGAPFLFLGLAVALWLSRTHREQLPSSEEEIKALVLPASPLVASLEEWPHEDPDDRQPGDIDAYRRIAAAIATQDAGNLSFSESPTTRDWERWRRENLESGG